MDIGTVSLSSPTTIELDCTTDAVNTSATVTNYQLVATLFGGIN
jgi:hypothetical protein